MVIQAVFGNSRGVENFLQDVQRFGLGFKLSHPAVLWGQGQCGQLKAHPSHTDDRTVGGIPHHASIGGHRSQRPEGAELG